MIFFISRFWMIFLAKLHENCQKNAKKWQKRVKNDKKCAVFSCLIINFIRDFDLEKGKS